MGGNHSKKEEKEKDFIEIDEEIINESQNIYCAWSKLRKASRNKIFISFKRMYPKGDPSYIDRKQCYALKVIEINERYTKEDFEREKNNLDLLEEFQQFIKYENPFELTIGNKNYILAPMKYYYQTDVYSYITRKGFTYDEEFVCLIAYKSLTILKTLKERQIVHNDIKLHNFILVSENPFELTLTDFEASQFLSEGEKSDIFGGTPIFESPEVLREELHDYASDLWSLGANIYYILFGTFPFDIHPIDSKEVMVNKMENNELLKLRDFVSDEAFDCVKRILVFEPNERIKVEDALNLDWFQSMRYVDVKVAAGIIGGTDFPDKITVV